MSNPLESYVPLATFADFSRAVPRRWKNAPLCIANSIGKYERAVRVLLVTDSSGRKLVVVDQNFSTYTQALIK